MSNYEKQNFVSGQILKAEHLNHMEDGIGYLSEEIGTYKKIVVQDTEPEDTTVLWVDTNDNSEDDKAELIEAIIASLPVYNGEVV